MRKLVLAVILLGLFTSQTVWASFESESWQFSKDLMVQQKGWVIVDLDPEVLKHSNQELADIRILDRNGREVVYQPMAADHYTRSYPARLFDVAVNSDYTFASLDIGSDGRLHNEISLDLKDIKNSYLREVTLEGSVDNQNWVVITKDKIFNLNNKDSRMNNSTISYSPVSFRYLRLKIDRNSEEPLVITGAAVYFLPDIKFTSTVLPTTVISNRSDYKTGVTDIILDLGVPNYLVTSIQFEVQDNNYERTVSCYTGKDLSEWNLMDSKDIFNYQWQDYAAERNEAEVHFISSRYLKLSIQNQDSPALNIGQIKIMGNNPKLLVNIQDEQNLLWYGNLSAQKPEYDLGKFAGQVDLENLPVVSLGSEKLNQDYQTPKKPWTERNRWLLNLIIVVTAAALGYFALKNLKEV